LNLKMPKTKAYAPKWFYDDVYRVNYYVDCGATGSKLVDWFNENDTQHILNWGGDEADGCSWNVLGYDQLIWVRKKSDIASLVHECVHAAQAVLVHRGIDCNEVGSEPMAYYIQYVFNKCREVLK